MSCRTDAPLRQRLERIGERTGTDKTSYHGYQRFYAPFLSLLPEDYDGAILEIGYGEGRSIGLWTDLFPRAHLWCFDRDQSLEGERFHVIRADQGDLASIEQAVQQIDRPVSLIVDDGSHIPRHQLESFSLLFRSLLQPEGIYFIEDIETSYWLTGELYGYPTRFGIQSPWSAVEAFKLAADYLNRHLLDPVDRDMIEYGLSLRGVSPDTAAEIGMLCFGQNCVALTRAASADDVYFRRPYPFAPFTSR